MLLQHACNLTEGKSFGGRRTFANEKATLMGTLVRLLGSLKSNLDRKMMSDAISDYGTLKEEFSDRIFGIFQSFQAKEIVLDDLESMWRSEIRNSWMKAYELGVRSVGNPFGIWEEDKSWIKGAETEEFGYLGKFIEDMKAGVLVMKAEDRLGMYVETLDGVYHHGMVDGSPDYVKIEWILKEARHCDECIKFAAGSPYTKKTLPAVPRDGTSRCLSNCRCQLRFEYSDKKPSPEAIVIAGPKVVRPPEGWRLPTFKEKDNLGAMSTEIDRLRAMITITSGDAKKELIQQRRDLNKDLIDYTDKHKVYYIPGQQVQRLKLSESIADECSETLFEGGPGSGNFGHKGRPGHRGGSLPGSVTSAHGNVHASSTFMANYLKPLIKGGMYQDSKSALNKLKADFPGMPEARYGRALVKAGLVATEGASIQGKMTPGEVKKALADNNFRLETLFPKVEERILSALALVPKDHFQWSYATAIKFVGNPGTCTETYKKYSGNDVALGLFVDGFYHYPTGELILGTTDSHIVLHEFAHSLVNAYPKIKGKVWRANASTGKISRYGKTSPAEAFAEGYTAYLLHPDIMKKKAPAIFKIYKDEVFK